MKTEDPAPVPAGVQTAPSDAPPADAVSSTKPTAPIAIPPEISHQAKMSLARVFASYAGKILRKDELSLADLELSLLLGQQAVDLDPTDVFAWRAIFNTTLLSDGTDPHIEELRSKAIERILALDPDDAQMRLRRLVELVERAPTAEERAAKFESILDPKARATIGNEVASRLAFKYAFLLQRTGDVEGFERWLGESVTLDPANPEATAIAAGYFRFASDDVAKEAELLMTAMVANPLDTLAMRGFASLLLSRGAYKGAARFLDICAQLGATDLPLLPYDQLLADVALARWAAGRPEEAEELLTRRQRQLNEYARREMGRADPALVADSKRLADVRFPVPGNAVVIRAAVVRSLRKDDELKATVADAFDSFEKEVERIEAAREEAEKAGATEDVQRLIADKAAVRVNAALFAFWIAEDAERGNQLLKAADELMPLSDTGKARYAAWTQLRSAEPAKALPLFEALADDRPETRSGLALAQLAAGDRRAAASTYLDLWRKHPDTLFGVDARDRLATMLGTVIPAEGAAAALEALADSVPPSFDRMFRTGSRPLAIRIRWGTHPTNVLERIPATVEIANLTQWPLAIDDSGPIRNILCFQASVTVAGRNEPIELPYLFHPLDRSFSIPARGTYSIPIDFAYTELGLAILPFTQPGCSVSIRALVNWDTTEGGLRANAFGDSTDADMLRVEGMRLSEEGIAAAIDRARAPKTFRDLVDFVAVVNAAGEASVRPAIASESRKALYARVWEALPDILSSLDVPTQCWLLFILPDNIPPLEPALERVRPSNDPLVRLSYLVRRAGASADPVVEAAIASGDQRIASYGRIVKEMLLHDEEVTRRDFNLGTGKESTSSAPKPGAAAPETPAPETPAPETPVPKP